MLKALDERKTMNLVTVAVGGPGPIRWMERIFLHGQNMRIGISIYASIVVPAAGHSTAQFPASCLIKKRLP
jgi:hypothetical protein